MGSLVEFGNVFVLILQKESLSDVQLHLAAMRGDAGVLKKILDSGKVHVDSKDKVGGSFIILQDISVCVNTENNYFLRNTIKI